MSKRTVHYTAPGFRTQLIEVAENAEEIPSKRYPLIENEDKSLIKNLGELEESTRSKNIEFEERLNEVRGQTAGWEARLRTEVKEAEECTMQLRADYQEHIQTFRQSIKSVLNKKFDHIDKSLFPIQIKKVDMIEKNMNIFVKITVPENIEKQSGEVSRKLKKQYETFDIEKQKENKREKKLVTKANDHIQNTSQKFTDENALMTARFFTVEEDIINRERRAARNHDRHFNNVAEQVEQCKTDLTMESENRRKEDETMLDNILETQSKLQRTVVEHFGADSDI